MAGTVAGHDVNKRNKRGQSKFICDRARQPRSGVFRRRGLRPLPDLAGKSDGRKCLRGACLCADDQPCASAGHPRPCRQPAADDATVRPSLRPPRQCGLPVDRHRAGAFRPASPPRTRGSDFPALAERVRFSISPEIIRRISASIGLPASVRVTCTKGVHR
jgi:hypothetical protein